MAFIIQLVFNTYPLECMYHFVVGVPQCVLAYLFIASHNALIKTLLECCCLFCRQNCEVWHRPSVFWHILQIIMARISKMCTSSLGTYKNSQKPLIGQSCFQHSLCCAECMWNFFVLSLIFSLMDKDCNHNYYFQVYWLFSVSQICKI